MPFDLNKKYSVYCIRNTVNNRCYVGSTFNIEYRLYMHRWYLDNGEHHIEALVSDWRKYGPSAFKLEVIEKDLPHNQRFEREQYWITKERAFPDGYNVNPRADTSAGA